VSVSVSPRRAALTLSETQQFSATVEGAANSGVTWSVDGAVGGTAAAGTISSSGLYAPPAAPGTHTISATSVADPTRSASAFLAVTDLAGVFTYHNDLARTGQNLHEFALAPATLSPATFGKLFSCSVDGFVYAQPLYVAGLAIPGRGTRNVVYVATENDSVYAFDADDPSCVLLWQASFTNPAVGVSSVPSNDLDCTDLVPEAGITGTPAIDPVTETLYVVAFSKENGSYFDRLHALDLATGAEKFSGPVALAASVAGQGDGSAGGTISFSAQYQNQRPALALSAGILYIASASFCDQGPYHGWLLAYDAATLQPLPPFNVTPNGSEGGIWLSGGGPAVDASGNLFLGAGNGTFDASTAGIDFGDSFLKLLASASGPAVADYFTPYNQAAMASEDSDFGSGGPLLLPDALGSPAHPHLALTADKQGFGYLVDRDNLGQFNPISNSQIVQFLPLSIHGIYSTPALWRNLIYVAGWADSLKAYPVANGLLATSPASQSSVLFGYPGATPSVSAAGSTGGIVWAIDSSGYTTNTAAILHAYDASNLASELYSSEQTSSRDQAGRAVKFTVPTVANGHVYLGGQGQLTVYGLLP
jgi:hypothetical protein